MNNPTARRFWCAVYKGIEGGRPWVTEPSTKKVHQKTGKVFKWVEVYATHQFVALMAVRHLVAHVGYDDIPKRILGDVLVVGVKNHPSAAGLVLGSLAR